MQEDYYSSSSQEHSSDDEDGDEEESEASAQELLPEPKLTDAQREVVQNEMRKRIVEIQKDTVLSGAEKAKKIQVRFSSISHSSMPNKCSLLLRAHTPHQKHFN